MILSYWEDVYDVVSPFFLVPLDAVLGECARDVGQRGDFLVLVDITNLCSLLCCVAFYIVPDNCAENLSDDASDRPMITLQTPDQSEPTEDQNLTIPEGSGQTTVTVRFSSGDPTTRIRTTVTAVRLQPASGSMTAPDRISVTDIILSDGTTANDIVNVPSTTQSSGMFRLDILRETPVDSFVITVDNADTSSVVSVEFDGCIKSG